jgi:trimethylamine:corrinoid methyltransferase-like protein
MFCGIYPTLEDFDTFTRWRSPTERRCSSRKETRKREILSSMDSKTFEPGMVSKIDNKGLKYGGINV